jgi:hypothetical protein
MYDKAKEKATLALAEFLAVNAARDKRRRL